MREQGRASVKANVKTPPPIQSEKEPTSMPKKKTAKDNGSKTAIVANLLKRKNGCTGKDVKQATGWPTVSMPALAKACGLKLRKEKTDKGMRYYGSAA
jgi:Protein of unknown function (DUF3489)